MAQPMYCHSDIEPHALPADDYSLVGSEERVAVECKSLADFAQTVSDVAGSTLRQLAHDVSLKSCDRISCCLSADTPRASIARFSRLRSQPFLVIQSTMG